LSPILGIWASQNYPRITSSYESIQTVTVGAGGTTAVTFSSIPSTFKHLQVRYIGRSSTDNNIRIDYNSDTSNNNYVFHNLRGDGSSTSTLAFVSGGSNSRILANEGVTTPTQGSNIFGVGVIDILDYANTNKYKTTRTLAGYDANGSGFVTLNSSLWMSTSAISSLSITNNSNTIQQYSQFALYGIKG
jgi:hypothetical protein